MDLSSSSIGREPWQHLPDTGEHVLIDIFVGAICQLFFCWDVFSLILISLLCSDFLACSLICCLSHIFHLLSDKKRTHKKILSADHLRRVVSMNRNEAQLREQPLWEWDGWASAYILGCWDGSRRRKARHRKFNRLVRIILHMNVKYVTVNFVPAVPRRWSRKDF